MLRGTLYALLVIVAGSAAVLSFTTLRDLALVCGFSPGTAWLLPLVIDAGAAAGSLAWLSRTGRARGYGRALALALLGLSVAGNALGHGLAATGQRPHWAVVVAVSAVAPAVLGAVVHLAVLAGRTETDQPADETSDAPVLSLHTTPLPAAGDDRVAELIAAGAGRRRLARELDISEHEARQLLDRERGDRDTG